MKNWYVVQTQPNSESRAQLNLARQGFEAYLPRYLKQRRHARKVEHVVRPLFPNYLFVLLDTERERWRSVNGTFGVSRLVSHGDVPLPVPEGVVEAIRMREDDRGLVATLSPVFRPGQKVEILEGPMAMCTGLFLHASDSDRVVLLLDMLGQQVRVKIRCTGVAAA
jgi:transcriptional antiterminator RfaH